MIIIIIIIIIISIIITIIILSSGHRHADGDSRLLRWGIPIYPGHPLQRNVERVQKESLFPSRWYSQNYSKATVL